MARSPEQDQDTSSFGLTIQQDTVEGDPAQSAELPFTPFSTWALEHGGLVGPDIDPRNGNVYTAIIFPDDKERIAQMKHPEATVHKIPLLPSRLAIDGLKQAG